MFSYNSFNTFWPSHTQRFLYDAKVATDSIPFMWSIVCINDNPKTMVSSVRFVPRQFQHLGLFQPRLQVRQQHRVTKIIDVRQQRLGMDVAQHRQHSETAGPYHRIH